MKRIVVLLLVLGMLFSLAACGGVDESIPTGESTAGTSEATTIDTEATTGTISTETTSTETPSTETISTETVSTEATQHEHIHSYISKVTKQATCTEKGLMTYTCACGASYVEEVNVAEHNFSGWVTYPSSSNNIPDEKKNVCSDCGYVKIEKEYMKVFKRYAKFVTDLGYFVSAETKQSSLADVIVAAYRNGVPRKDEVINVVLSTSTIAVADMDAFTTAYLGTTYNYTGVKNMDIMNGARCNYDAKTNALVITNIISGGGKTDPIDSVKFTTKDHVNFLVTVTHPSSAGNSWSSEMAVSLIDGKYIITSYNVSAENQMANADEVSFLGNSDAPLKVLILGNSITRHGPNAAVGWNNDWGMAASSAEKDYVHRLYAKLTEGGSDVYMRIRQASWWERNFNDPNCLAEFEGEKLFGADIIIFRLGENVLKEDYPSLSDAIVEFMNYLSKTDTKIILTSCAMWNPTCDREISKAATRLGSRWANVTCSKKSYLAYDQPVHPGVQQHPGDSGMEMIASRIYQEMLNYI